MRVVDSSAWIELLLASKTGHALRPSVPGRERWVVPTIIQLELAKWAYRALDPTPADEIIAFSQKCIIVQLSSEIAISAAALCKRHKLATADAIVYATAQASGADLLTCDAHFKSLPNVFFVEKQN
jgi:uncharacterized protein